MALKDIEVQKFFDRKKAKLNIELEITPALIKTKKLEPKWSQTGAKVESNWSQSGVKLEPQNEISRAKVETQLEPQNEISRAKVESNWSQYNGKFKNNTSFSQLVGLQRKIILCIYENCKISRSNISQELTIEFINTYCKTTRCTIKKAIQRLIKKGVLIRKFFKDGRSGWTCYELPKFLYYEIVHIETGAKVEPNWSQSRAKVGAQLETKLEPTISSSSSYLLNTTTTGNTQGLVEPQLLPEWQNFDIEPLNKIGFTTTHLSQIAEQNKLQPQAVQDSIYAFSFDLQENNKAKSIKGDPINYFMGILRNGRVYTFPSNYESPQDKAMRLYTEQIRVADQKRKLLEKESLDLAFGEWFGKLTEAQKIAFLPENMQNTKIAFGKNKVIESAARSHFEAEIWPDMKQTIIKSAINPDQGLQNQISTNSEQEVPNVENN